jgi:hypothetical protein
MPANDTALDLARIQTTAQAIANQACWIYVAQPGKIDEIVGALASSLDGLRGIGGAVFQCKPGWCPEGNMCVPCQVIPAAPSTRRRPPRRQAGAEMPPHRPSARGPKRPRAGM